MKICKSLEYSVEFFRVQIQLGLCIQERHRNDLILTEIYFIFYWSHKSRVVWAKRFVVVSTRVLVVLFVLRK
jgi:hypothetical protein